MGPTIWIYLQKCPHHFISITQKHFFFFFSFSLTHHSFLWVLGDENWNWKQIQKSIPNMGPIIFEWWMMKFEWWVSKNMKSKHVLTRLVQGPLYYKIYKHHSYHLLFHRLSHLGSPILNLIVLSIPHSLLFEMSGKFFRFYTYVLLVCISLHLFHFSFPFHFLFIFV